MEYPIFFLPNVLHTYILTSENLTKIWISKSERENYVTKEVELILLQQGHLVSYWEQNIDEKSRIRDTKHLSTDADGSTNIKKILLVRQNLPKN